MMREIWKYPRDVIQYVKSSYCIDNLFIIYLFLKRNSILNIINVSCGIFSKVIISNIISLVLRDSDAGSDNFSLIRRSVSGGQKTSVQRVYHWQVYNKVCYRRGIMRARIVMQKKMFCNISQSVSHKKENKRNNNNKKKTF